MFSPFNCCVSVVLLFDKGDCPENLQIVWICVLRNTLSFEPFIYLDLVFRTIAVTLVSDLLKKIQVKGTWWQTNDDEENSHTNG